MVSSSDDWVRRISFPLIAGGAVNCVSTHVGEIRPGAMRGNHRHHDCNETFVIWGARMKVRVRID